MIIVYKISANMKKDIIDFYKPMFKSNKPPYSVFQAVCADSIITLYESGKLMIQGKSADVDANIWFDLELKKNNRDVRKEINQKDEKKKENEKDYRFLNVSTIGSDEVGTGDYFGPIVVTASFVSADKINYVRNLGVRDSKKITDDKILKIAPDLIREIPHVTYVLDNKTYNNNDANMNKVKAILHNKVLSELIKKVNDNYEYIVVDQFCFPKNYFEYLSGAKEIVKQITFTPKAEDKCYSVAVSSIISRYIFINEMNKIGDEYQIFIKKGAGPEVDQIGTMLVKKYGIKVLEDIAKINFKNTDKIKNLLNK